MEILNKFYFPIEMNETGKAIQRYLDNMHNQEKWDRRFLDMAKLVASWSRDPSTKTGAVFVGKRKNVISVGFNGFPQRLEDRVEDYENRDLKYKKICHCEVNASIFADNSRLEGSTLYTWPFQSCERCMSQMIQIGISRHVAPICDNPRWRDSFELSTKMMLEAEVELVLLDYK